MSTAQSTEQSYSVEEDAVFVGDTSSDPTKITISSKGKIVTITSTDNLNVSTNNNASRTKYVYALNETMNKLKTIRYIKQSYVNNVAELSAILTNLREYVDTYHENIDNIYHETNLFAFPVQSENEMLVEINAFYNSYTDYAGQLTAEMDKLDDLVEKFPYFYDVPFNSSHLPTKYKMQAIVNQVNRIMRNIHYASQYIQLRIADILKVV
jgi:hypothetical protein